ncbi:hypothetical protein PV326_011399, partial [Microctonus aethiopoides]
HPKAAEKMSPHANQTVVWRARQDLMPNIPTSLQSFIDMKNSIPAILLTAYHGHFRTADNDIGLVFTSQQLLGAMKHFTSTDTTELYIDGTFAGADYQRPAADHARPIS